MNRERGTARATGTKPWRQEPRYRLLPMLAVVLMLAGGGCGSAEVPSPTTSVPGATAAEGSILVDPSVDTLLVGDSQQLVAMLRGAKGRRLSGIAISWASSSPDIASVSPAGVVTSHAPGTARILATSEGKSGTTVITVWPTKK